MAGFRLGKLPPKLDARTLRFGAYLTPGLAPPPVDCLDYEKKVAIWGVMGNDTLGDCTCAAAGHLVQEWTANNAGMVVVPDADIIAFYRNFSPAPTDDGANLLDVLNLWRQTGLPGHNIAAYAALETANTTEAKDAVNLFGGCYIGLALPNFAVPGGYGDPSVDWVVPQGGAVGDAAPNSANGHCVPAIAYDDRNLWVVTWGVLKPMSWQFYTTYMDEAYAVLSNEWLTNGKSPAGFDFAQLNTDLNAVTHA